MKKYLLTILFAFCATFNMYAVTVDVDGIRYEIISTEALTARIRGFADTKFSDVVIPEYIEYYGKKFKIIEIADNAFLGSSNNLGLPEHITLPSTLTTIGEKALRFTRIEELIIPDNVTTLKKQFASFSPKLKKIVFGRGVETIPVYSINDAEPEYVFIPNTVVNIEYAGIYGLNIEELIIEDSAKKINSKSPDGMSKPSALWYNGTEFNTGSSYSIGDGDYCSFPCCNIQNLYLGRNMAVAYKTASSNAIKAQPNVKNLTVGPYVTDIKGLFNLNYMQRIKLMTSTPPIFGRETATEECYMRVKVYVPKGSLKAYQSHSEWGKYWNIEEYDESCAAPEISYEDGMLKVTPVTQGSICHYTIIDNDIVTDAEITGGVRLSGTYEIEAYAVLNGSKSERSYATLCWIDNTFNGVGITQPFAESKRPVIIKSNNGQIVIEGLEDGETIHLYTIDGKLLGRTSAYGGSATFDTMQESGQTLIIRAGENSIKFLMR